MRRMDSKPLTVGQLAARCRVAVKTVQFYAEEGLLRARGGTTEAGYRLFTEDDVADLRAIRSLRALGFSLEAIRGMLAGSADARSTAQLQLELVDAQLRALRRQRAAIAAAISPTRTQTSAGACSSRRQPHRLARWSAMRRSSASWIASAKALRWSPIPSSAR